MNGWASDMNNPHTLLRKPTSVPRKPARRGLGVCAPPAWGGEPRHPPENLGEVRGGRGEEEAEERKRNVPGTREEKQGRPPTSITEAFQDLSKVDLAC